MRMTTITVSSNVKAMGYDERTQTLHVTYSKDETYEYKGVPADVWADLQSAESKGKFLNASVKGRYAHRNLGKVEAGEQPA